MELAAKTRFGGVHKGSTTESPKRGVWTSPAQGGWRRLRPLYKAVACEPFPEPSLTLPFSSGGKCAPLAAHVISGDELSGLPIQKSTGEAVHVQLPSSF
jgi:hypothetical protein